VKPLLVPDPFAGGRDVLRTLESRASVRHFADVSLSEAQLHRLVEAARRAPTSSNLQAYSLIRVTDPQTRRRLAELAGEQRHVAEAPVLFVLCADLARLDRAADMTGVRRGSDTLEALLVATIDASLVGMSLSLAAESLGWGSCMIGGLRKHTEAVAQLLGLPPRVFAVFGLCIGQIARRPPQKPRLPQSVVVHSEKYDEAGQEAGIRHFDRVLAEHYRAQGRSSPDDAWSRHGATLMSQRPLAGLRGALQRLGFRLGDAGASAPERDPSAHG